MKKVGNPNTSPENIQLGHRYGIRFRKFAMRSGKWHMTEGIELPHQEKKIRKLREKETYEYDWILEAGIIKQVEIKKN